MEIRHEVTGMGRTFGADRRPLSDQDRAKPLEEAEFQRELARRLSKDEAGSWGVGDGGVSIPMEAPLLPTSIAEARSALDHAGSPADEKRMGEAMAAAAAKAHSPISVALKMELLERARKRGEIEPKIERFTIG
jgi:hypothetical protein